MIDEIFLVQIQVIKEILEVVVIQSRRLVEIDAGDDWADKLLESKRLCAEVLLVYNSVEDGQLFGI